MSRPSQPGGKRERRHPRVDYRARSHENAHANGDDKPAAIPVDPLIPGGAAELITTQAALDELIESLGRLRCFAFDSEFIGELSYFPKLCLIQTATTQHIRLIDPLAGLDLRGFWDLLANSSIEKIVHAGQQDIEPVHRLSGKAAANTFDVQIAAGFIGMSYPLGLSKLVRELTGVRLGKGFTFTHWDQRPLTSVQLRYAADDVRYLHALRAVIGKKLDQMGHVEWARQECASFCDPSVYEFDPAEDYLRVRGAGGLPPRNAVILRELFAWREDAARRHDSPPRGYLKDEILVDMARSPVKEVSDLARVRGLPKPVEMAEGDRIVQATERGLALPATQLPPVERPEETAGERFGTDSLWSTIQVWCHGQGVDPALVTSRQEVIRFYRDIQNGAPPADHHLLRGWRGELLGMKLMEFLEGKRSVSVRWERGVLRSQV